MADWKAGLTVAQMVACWAGQRVDRSAELRVAPRVAPKAALMAVH